MYEIFFVNLSFIILCPVFLHKYTITLKPKKLKQPKNLNKF